MLAQIGFNLNGTVIAQNVSEADYLEQYAAFHCEWVEGTVIRMSPVSEQHDLTHSYLRTLLDTYFALRPIGTVRSAPFVMKPLPTVNRWREPDLQIILAANRVHLTPTSMEGPADICIEILSEATEAVDRGDKFVEYQEAGVREYWLLDHRRRAAHFHVLNADHLYILHTADSNGDYQTSLLPGLRLYVPLLWQTPLPNPLEIVAAVESMLKH
jgi:Uma2 family endonuclease